MATARSRPRVGFLGVGWIGRNRMEAIAQAGLVEIVAVAEPDPAALAAALLTAPGARPVASLEALLALDLDGLVIATPSALHAEQSIAALERGAAVFCQKPLGRSAAEVRAVLDAARRADRLLAVDMSYRFTAAAAAVRRKVRAGAIGRVFAADLIFHNAYGPDKPWFRNRALSGGGCVMDLGVHLVDLALWTLDFPKVTSISSVLFAAGELLESNPTEVEDYAVVTLMLEHDIVVRIACSWNLSAGRDAIIETSFLGTQGGVAMRNVDGSFFDFEATLNQGSHTKEILSVPPDAWSGRAAVDWSSALSGSPAFSPDIDDMQGVYEVLDGIMNNGETTALI